MALWQIIDTKKKASLKEQWDDGLGLHPWDEGFTTDKVRSYAGEGNFNYIGTPTWEPPEEADDE